MILACKDEMENPVLRFVNIFLVRANNFREETTNEMT